MSEITDDVIIRQLRETVERQAQELAELRRLVEALGRTGHSLTWGDLVGAVGECRDYNSRKAIQCPTSDT